MFNIFKRKKVLPFVERTNDKFIQLESGQLIILVDDDFFLLQDDRLFQLIPVPMNDEELKDSGIEIVE